MQKPPPINASVKEKQTLKKHHRIKAVDLTASVCLLIGSVINIVELFIDVHFIISVVATVLVLISFFLWFVVLKKMKSEKSDTKLKNPRI